ncbi:hypothetical protein [Flavobacterium piscinae]|uniref:hypothetical protein n=1 Tax=Flavobacterium piscinae TaxID=2506424 RepID=UPI002AABA4CC|nr:hypothetical protein [Flavobacterium piscinae]
MIFAADKAYPWLIQFLPTGLKGLAFVALTAKNCIVFGFHAELNFYYFYDGYLQTIHQQKIR